MNDSLGYFELMNKVGLIVPPKCASSAMYNTAIRASSIDKQRFNTLPSKFMFMREPKARLESAYRMAVSSIKFVPRYGSFLEPDVFVRWISTNLEDPTVICQCEWLKGMGAVGIIRWDFDRLAELIGAGHVPVYNDSDKNITVPWSDRAHALVDEIYENSLNLWYE